MDGYGYGFPATNNTNSEVQVMLLEATISSVCLSAVDLKRIFHESVMAMVHKNLQ